MMCTILSIIAPHKLIKFAAAQLFPNSYYIMRIVRWNRDVVGFSGANVPHELVFLPGQIFRLGGRTSNATHELLFIASEVSPLGLVNYHVERINEPESPPRPMPHNSTEDVTIDNGVWHQNNNNNDIKLY